MSKRSHESAGSADPPSGEASRRHDEEAGRIRRALRTRSALIRTLVHATEEPALLGEACRVAVEEGGYVMAWVGLAEHDARRTVRPVARAGNEAGYLDTADITWADEPRGRGPTGTAIRTRQPAVCRDMHADPQFAPWRAEAVRRGYAASIVLPLLSGGEAFGAISLYAAEPSSFDPLEVALLEELAGDLVFGIQSLRARQAHAQATERLEHALAYNRSLLEAAVDPLVVIGLDGRISDVNGATERATGRARAELLGTDFSNYFTDPGRARAGYEQIIKDGCIRDCPLQLQHRDGHSLAVAYNGSVYRDEHGAVIGVFVAARDITELRRAETEVRALAATLEQRVTERTRDLAASEERLRAVLQATKTGTFELDLNTGEGQWNDVEYELLGLKPGEAQPGPDTFFRYLHPEDVGKLRIAWEEATRTGALDAEFRVIRADGEVRWLKGKGHFVQGITHGAVPTAPAGRPTRYLGVNYDITGQKLAEQALRQIQVDLDRAQQVGQIGSWRLDVQANRLTWSAENHRIFGVSPGTPLTYESFLAVVHPDDRAAVDQQWQAGLRGAPFDIEHRLVVAGRVKWVREKAYLEYDAGGQLRGGFGITQDITARKQAERALGESERLLSLAVHAAQAGIWDWDIASGRLEWSPELYHLFGLDPAHGEASFAVWREALHPADREAAEARIREAVRNRARLQSEYRVVLPSGEPRWIVALGDTSNDDEGRPRRMTGICLDITARKRAELELRKLATDLNLTIAELESFSYSVAHDLRAPLRSIDGFSRIVLEDCRDRLDKENRDNLERVRAATQRMGELIDDLLKLSRVVRADMRTVPVDLASVARALLEQRQQAEPGRRVESVVAPELPVLADPALLRVVLDNLLDNAWKFTARRAEARIEVGAVIRDGERVFFVRDNGAGFDTAYAAKLFNAFQRLHGQDEYPGHGIGLATVQRIIRRHGGRIWAEGRVNHGAAFFFTLPEHPTNP